MRIKENEIDRMQREARQQGKTYADLQKEESIKLMGKVRAPKGLMKVGWSGHQNRLGGK